MKLSKLKLTANNPRYIKDDKFESLKNSIKEFPKMLELRPIVYDPKTFELLGGNMRLRALQELGYKEIPDNWTKPADKLTAEEMKRFIIVDNLGFGQWDMDILANEWDEELLQDWGMDIDFPVDDEEGEVDPEKIDGAEMVLKVFLGDGESLTDLYNELIDKGYKCELK